MWNLQPVAKCMVMKGCTLAYTIILNMTQKFMPKLNNKAVHYGATTATHVFSRTFGNTI